MVEATSMLCYFILMFLFNVTFPFFIVQVPEPSWHVSGGRRGGSGLHRFSVGRREQGHHQDFQKEEPHFVCYWSHGHQLLSAVTVWGCHGLHLRNHIPIAL